MNEPTDKENCLFSIDEAVSEMSQNKCEVADSWLHLAHYWMRRIPMEITEEGFRTILLEYDYPIIVIDWLWEGRPSGDITEDHVRYVAVEAKCLVGPLEIMLESVKEA